MCDHAGSQDYQCGSRNDFYLLQVKINHAEFGKPDKNRVKHSSLNTSFPWYVYF